MTPLIILDFVLEMSVPGTFPFALCYPTVVSVPREMHPGLADSRDCQENGEGSTCRGALSTRLGGHPGPDEHGAPGGG